MLTLFIEYGICSALANWLQPLPDHSLPHMKIREGILDALGTVSSLLLPPLCTLFLLSLFLLLFFSFFLNLLLLLLFLLFLLLLLLLLLYVCNPQFPHLDSSILKTSKLGKEVVMCYCHPKESKKNREKAGKLISKCLVISMQYCHDTILNYE